MTNVPVNTGTQPKAPAAAIWSARMGICGSQFRPNRNSWIGTSEKKCQASKTSAKMMPPVVNTATTEQKIISPSTIRSKAWRARNSAETRLRASAIIASPSTAAPATSSQADRL